MGRLITRSQTSVKLLTPLIMTSPQCHKHNIPAQSSQAKTSHEIIGERGEKKGEGGSLPQITGRARRDKKEVSSTRLVIKQKKAVKIITASMFFIGDPGGIRTRDLHRDRVAC